MLEETKKMRTTAVDRNTFMQAKARAHVFRKQQLPAGQTTSRMISLVSNGLVPLRRKFPDICDHTARAVSS